MTKSQIMKRAWEIYRTLIGGDRIARISVAMKQAWAEAKATPKTSYISEDKALYNNEEILIVKKIANFSLSDTDVLVPVSDGNGNITLKYAEPFEYKERNSKSTYAIYKLACGITNADYCYDYEEKSVVNSENEIYDIKSVGIDWNNVKSVSGKTFNVKSLLKAKGFKWNGTAKNWVKA